jgi:hypothetical protein
MHHQEWLAAARWFVVGRLLGFWLLSDQLLLLLLLLNHPSTEIINIVRHYIIQRIASFAITLYYHPAGLERPVIC